LPFVRPEILKLSPVDFKVFVATMVPTASVAVRVYPAMTPVPLDGAVQLAVMLPALATTVSDGAPGAPVEVATAVVEALSFW